jgi:hypothetical protein
MTDPITEAAARAICEARGKDPDETWQEFDRTAALSGAPDEQVFPSFVRWNDHTAEAYAAITAIEPMIRAQVEREIVAYLDQLDAERRETNLLAWAARKIEAGEYRRHNPNCAVVRNGNLRAWCDCGLEAKENTK